MEMFWPLDVLWTNIMLALKPFPTTSQVKIAQIPVSCGCGYAVISLSLSSHSAGRNPYPVLEGRYSSNTTKQPYFFYTFMYLCPGIVIVYM